MKTFLFLAVMFVAGFSFAQQENVHPKTSYTLLEKTLIELFTPFAKARGFHAISINQDFEHPQYVGGVNTLNGEIRVIFGSEFNAVYPELSEDAYAKILCHELGHILGGTAANEQDPGVQISPEAGSDYFAGAVCLPKLFKNLPASNLIIADPIVTTNCGLQFTNAAEQLICQRVAMAGLSFFTSFHHAMVRSIPGIENEKFYAVPDLNVKDTGYYDFYPSFQCRGETLAAGAYCPTSQGLWDQGIKNWHCKSGLGARPSCWFKN